MLISVRKPPTTSKPAINMPCLRRSPLTELAISISLSFSGSVFAVPPIAKFP